MMTDILDFLLARRSVPVAMIGEPGPDPDQLRQILTAGARVPDHGKLAPWRFIVFQGDARLKFGDCLAKSFAAENPKADQAQIYGERGRFARAPVVIGVVASPQEHFKIPEWEQLLSAGAACQNILSASLGLGFGAQWLTQWPAYSPGVSRHLKLGEAEKVAGFIYIGTAETVPDDRARPDLDDVTEYWDGPEPTDI
jgi:nitroreductase